MILRKENKGFLYRSNIEWIRGCTSTFLDMTPDLHIVHKINALFNKIKILNTLQRLLRTISAERIAQLKLLEFSAQSLMTNSNKYLRSTLDAEARNNNKMISNPEELMEGLENG